MVTLPAGVNLKEMIFKTFQIRAESNNQLAFNDIAPIVGLNDTFVNRNASNCDLLQIDSIVTEDGGKYSLAFVVNVS